MNTNDMIAALSENGRRTDKLEAMLEEYRVTGIAFLTDEQIKSFYSKNRPERKTDEKGQTTF